MSFVASYNFLSYEPSSASFSEPPKLRTIILFPLICKLAWVLLGSLSTRFISKSCDITVIDVLQFQSKDMKANIHMNSHLKKHKEVTMPAALVAIKELYCWTEAFIGFAVLLINCSPARIRIISRHVLPKGRRSSGTRPKSNRGEWFEPRELCLSHRWCKPGKGNAMRPWGAQIVPASVLCFIHHCNSDIFQFWTVIWRHPL